MGIILAIGIFLRLTEYMANRSLNVDESFTANCVLSQSIAETTQLKGSNLEKMQSYPIMFLLIEKISTRFFGPSEMSLRLYPFVCGIISLFLFMPIAQKLLPPFWSLVAFGLFAISRDLVYYASELKPYASDIMMVLLLYLMFFRVISQPLSLFMVASYGLLGAASIYFSFPSVFILMGAGGCLFFNCLYERDYQQAKILTLLLVFWLGSLIFYYYFSLQYFLQNKDLVGFWAPNFMPLKNGPVAVFQWLIASFKRMFYRSLQLPSSFAAVGFLIGGSVLFLQERRKALLLFGPFVAVLLSSALEIYPFDGRVIAFLLPAVIWIVVYGLQVIAQNKVGGYKNLLCSILVICLFFYPVLFSARQFLEPLGTEEIKPVLSYIQKHKEPNDVIVIHHGSRFAYQYYASRYGLPGEAFSVLGGKWTQDGYVLKDNFKSVLGKKRVWIIFTHVPFYKDKSERNSILGILNRYGRQKYFFLVKVAPFSTPADLEDDLSASVYLYDFSQAS